MRLLLFSNSTMPGTPFMEWTESYILKFLGNQSIRVIFIPYAAVSFSYDEYEEKVGERFRSWGYSLTSAHRFSNPKEAIMVADVIVTGGGNTFHLLKNLQDNELMQTVRKKVYSGTPYIGWSAGSNVACSTICTTNDMPIVQPENFEAFGFLPFQINPHYQNVVVPGHGGETRDERLAEFLTANPNATVLGLPEGSCLHLENNVLLLEGTQTASLMNYQKPRVEYIPNSDLSFLLK